MFEFNTGIVFRKQEEQLVLLSRSELHFVVDGEVQMLFK